MSDSVYGEVLALAEADDPRCVEALAQFTDPELVGELMTAVYRTGTAAGRAALTPLYANPFQRGYWQGCKRIFKLAEASFDVEPLCALAFSIDQARLQWPYVRTQAYMQRRSYRVFKRVAVERPELFMACMEDLLPRYGARDFSVLLGRLLRSEALNVVRAAEQAVARFSPRLENPFVEQLEAAPEADDLLDLDDSALLASADPATGDADELAPPPPAVPAWKGPIFPELWLADPARLIGLLERAHARVVSPALTRLVERLGDRLHAVPLEAFYRLLEHPTPLVWRLGLHELAARARQETLQLDRLVPLFERARLEGGAGVGPDWDVIGDLLFVLDDARAVEAHAGLGAPLRDLVVQFGAAAGVGPVVAFFRRHLAAQVGAPLWTWDHALALLGSPRPDVRELGAEVARALSQTEAVQPDPLRRLLTSAWVEEDPEGVHALLTGTAVLPGGWRPGQAWTPEQCVDCLRALPEAGFLALRKALLAFEAEGGLPAELATRLLTQDDRRERELGRELLGAALDRGAVDMLDLVGQLQTRHEDVIVWLQERLEQAAVDGRLPNEALYRMLDGLRRDVQGFARGLVREHLTRFEAAELIVFCAESPDATTADLGIELYQQELREHDFDLRALLPMFRILLYKVAAARREKDRLFQTLRRWALEGQAQAQLVADVVAAFRRSEAELDFTKALTLLVELGQRFPELELPFAATATFGWTPEEVA